MHRLSIVLLLFLFCFVSIETRKVTQKPKSAPAPAPRAQAPAPKSDKSWARSMIDSAKKKYASAKEKLKSAKGKESKLAPSPAPRAPKTTKKSLFERAKEKVREKDLVNKGVAFVKKDLGIGVVGPKKPSKILKYGKKAVEKIFRKSHPPGNTVGGAAIVQQQMGSVGSVGSVGQAPLHKTASRFRPKVQFLQNHLSSVQKVRQESWNSSEAGTKYKLFEDGKSWDDAQIHCQDLGSHLAYLDSESKNAFAAELLFSHNATLAWFGLRTEIGAAAESFSNLPSLNGCGVLESSGSWSISSCSLHLPYICQALRLNVLVEIPSAAES